MTLSARKPLLIDALQYNKPERARFEEWKRGGVGCVHVTLSIWENARETLTVIGEWNRLLEQNADLIALATTGEDIERIAASGRTAVVYGFQDTSPFEDDIELIEIFYQLGVRIAQLTYNVQNRVASGCWEPDEAGVSKFFGRNVIAEMNRVGMVVDVSHCTERTCFDAIEYSSRPIAVTHANPQEFVGTDIELNRRNKSTALIKRLAETGGVIGLSNYPKIMKNGSDCTLDTFLDMVAWTVDLVGADHVGLGTDFYDGWPESQIKWWRAGRWARESAIPIKGFSKWPSWFQSPVDFPNILEGLEKRGFSGEEIAGIVGGNWLKLFREGFVPAASVKTADAA
ncbi:membrane dipeptidase [Shinella sp. 838]|jgi:membrane dipeptidase|uniref:dipeptidase n=1 Tax=unclassified Shinella TaxID=2643062 RepID=UPI0003C53451|nr:MULTISPECIES: membrane dipeptidase [unclassified Shinella]EYR84367.1 dipeptidase [Shinella sp. DD12]MDG4673420.1 membrane dipeptidase [Shinella sp. 838]